MIVKKVILILIISLFTLLHAETVYEYRNLTIEGELKLAYVKIEYDSTGSEIVEERGKQ
jgi:hypothetical protein